jgi:hypothetical protein
MTVTPATGTSSRRGHREVRPRRSIMVSLAWRGFPSARLGSGGEAVLNGFDLRRAQRMGATMAPDRPPSPSQCFSSAAPPSALSASSGRPSWPRSPPRRSQLRPCRPCPPRDPSIGIWRSLTVNNGRSQEALTCAIGVHQAGTTSPDAPSKLVTAGATSGPQPGHKRPDRCDNNGHRRAITCPAHRAHSHTRRRSPPPARTP